MKKVILIMAMILTAVSISAQIPENPDGPQGFLSVRSQSVIQQLRFGMQNHNPWVAPAGTVNLYLEHHWNNLWMYEPDFYRFDAEIHEIALRGCVGLGRGFEMSFEFPMRYVSGGVLDRTIEGFHRTIGIGNANRDSFPRNQFFFALRPDENSEWITAGQEQIGWHFANTILSASYRFMDRSTGDITSVITANIKIPSGSRSDIFGGQSVDIGLSISTMARWGDYYFYAGPGMVYYFDDNMIGLELIKYHLSALLAIEHHREKSRNSWIVQMLVENGFARDYFEFSQNTYELMFAFKRRLSANTTLEIGVLENLFFFDNSPDIGFHLGVTRQLKF